MKVKLLKRIRKEFRKHYIVYALKVSGVTYYHCSRIYKCTWLKREPFILKLKQESFYFIGHRIARYRTKQCKRIKFNIWE